MASLLLDELLRMLLPLGRHKLTAHLASIVVVTIPVVVLRMRIVTGL